MRREDYDRLATGSAVRIRGLVKHTQLNGTLGRVCSYDEAKGRYGVVIPLAPGMQSAWGGHAISLKRSCLMRCGMPPWIPPC